MVVKPRKETIMVLQVATAVADVTSVPLDEICNRNKTHDQKVADARGLAIYLARNCTVQSLPEIAAFFKCTHVQILSISKKMRTRLLADDSLRGQLDAIVVRIHDRVK